MRILAAVGLVVAATATGCTSADQDMAASVPPAVTVPMVTAYPVGMATRESPHLTLHVGEHRAYRLRPLGVPGVFDPIVSSRGGVVDIVQAGGYPAGGPLVATVTATTTGKTNLYTQSDLACFHADLPCLPPQTTWTLVVTVVP